ncbi:MULTISPECIES: adenylate kinase family protein [Nocardia]|uniref:adenylate kinase family protein n=1 Tax=Nocardia TaxID=1817 RepID=UPI001562A721|nr:MULTISPECIES: nucleoside monophosphate kinase [Nocardia]MBF6187035.1 nucleoside monophosphate kinase [Nocardia farcinica]MBF6312682.1 nucleoside monophosphate kinase [Nocardia farcinica]MBF6408463.1 nucleoside monophosphate kinase [Nocardia farcinica]UEX23548.1 nucleoside monophosphate kinase [Nocardia farcinica]
MTAPSIAILGLPGSGKGTQSQLLSQTLGLPRIPPGELLRAEIGKDSDLGRQAATAVTSGIPVADAIIFELVDRVIPADRPSILDGFPADPGQASWLLAHPAMATTTLVALHLVVPPQVAAARLLGRSHTQARADDTAEIIEKRLNRSRTAVTQTVSYLQDRASVVIVDGEGQPSDVNDAIVAALSPFLP